MNTRSLRFQLVAWYAGLLTVCFILIGAAAYVVLQSSLVGALRENQLRRARQIGQLLFEEIPRQGETKVGDEIEARYAPGFSDRFVRVTRGDGGLLYVSRPPKERNFVPASVPPPTGSGRRETVRRVPVRDGGELLVATCEVQAPGGARYLIETGAPMDDRAGSLAPVADVPPRGPPGRGGAGGGRRFRSCETSALAGGQDCHQRGADQFA